MSREMKDSGVKWIGMIPKEWKVVRVKNKYSCNKLIAGRESEKYERLSLTMNGVLKRSKEDNNGLQPEKFEGYQILKEKELVFKLIDLENIATSRVGLSPYTGLVSPAYIVLHNNSETEFGYYYFISMYYQEIFNKLGGDGVRSNLNVKDLLEIPYIEIDDNEKRLIVNYLNEKVSQIDTVIQKQTRLIEEYKNYKQALITEIVTKGLNPNVEMKDSGIEWIGKVPRHWKLQKVKYIFEIKKEIANETGIDILSVTQSGIKIKDISKNEGQLAQDYSKYQRVNRNDFVMNHMDLLTGWVDCSKYEGVTSPDYRVFRLKNEEIYNKEYYKYILQICYLNKIFYGLGQGVSTLGRWRLQTESFLNFVMPIPTREEQNMIVKNIEEKFNRIDKLIEDKCLLIKELETYKKSLIYEYVTGKKEIRSTYKANDIETLEEVAVTNEKN